MPLNEECVARDPEICNSNYVSGQLSLIQLELVNNNFESKSLLPLKRCELSRETFVTVQRPSLGHRSPRSDTSPARKAARVESGGRPVAGLRTRPAI